MTAGASDEFQRSWALLRRGMARADVHRMLGSPSEAKPIQHATLDTWGFRRGHPLYYQYPSNWDYVVWYDAGGRVASFRTPFR